MRLTLKILFFALSLSAATPDVWAADEASPKKNSDWEIDDASEKSGADAAGGGIELMQAQEGTFIGAQKSHDGIMIFTGGIVVRINNKIIRAETVKINPYTGEIYGEGGVTLTDELQTIRGSSFIYDNRIGAGVLYDTKGYYEPMYLIGDFTKISSRDSFLVSAAYLTTCTAESPHYYLKARKIWLQKGNRFTAAGALPIGLAHGVRVASPVAEGVVVRWEDVEVDPGSEAVRFRREMEALAAG